MSSRMDPTLRGGIVALLRTGHAAPAIADLLACSQKTVARVQLAETASPSYPEERWAAGRRGHYNEDLNQDIRMMLAEDRPTEQIAKLCRCSEQLVRQLRQHDCPATIGTRRVEDALLDARPFRIGRAGAALRFESIAACYADCLAAGEGALRRLIFELRALVSDGALPDPHAELLASTLREWEQRRLSKLELGARLDEIGARLNARADQAAPARRERAS